MTASPSQAGGFGVSCVVSDPRKDTPDFAGLSLYTAPLRRADALTCALALLGTSTPTPAELATALAEVAPHGPTVADLLGAGQMVPAVSDRRRLRLPPMSLAEQDARVAAAAKTPVRAAPAVGLFSYYTGGITTTAPYAAIAVRQLYAVLTSPRARARTEALRAAPVGSPQRDELKRGLDYVTPAGTFTHRANNRLENPSGLLVLDFDHVPDLSAARAALLADALLAPELVLLFTSPSGDGLKALVKADPAAGHLDNFRAYAGYLAAHYTPLGLCPDEAGKDVARACFVPYAADAWLAPAYAA